MTTSYNGSRLLLLHISGADWQIAQSLVDTKRMPNLNALIDRGTIGNLMSAVPRIRPSLAASLVTGRHGDAHGILGYNKPDLKSPLGLRPVQSTDLRALPIWEIAAAAGLKASAVGWPVSHPATVFDATIVSDAFADAQGASFDDWPLNDETVSDPTVREALAELRLHPTEVTADMVLPFLPQGHNIDQETDERLALLVATLARTASIHGAATWIAEHQTWDLLAVHFDLIEKLSSAFLQYRTPQMAHVTDSDFGIYNGVVDGAYQFFDMLLGRYLELVDADCHVILVSDHGYLIDSLRPPPPPAHVGVRVGQTYRELGLFAVAGPAVKQDELVFGANIIDVALTALSILGLPVSLEMEGRVLNDVFEITPPKQEVDHFDQPDFGARDSDDSDWTLPCRRVIEYSELGYHAAPPADPELAHEMAEIIWLANLSQVHASKRNHAEALDPLQRLLELAPDHPFGLQQAAQCYLALGDTKSCRQCLDNLTAAHHDSPLVKLLLGKLALAEGDMAAAEKYLDEAEKWDKGGIGGQRLLEFIGCTRLSAKQLNKAERAFHKALEIDPDSALAHKALGATLLKRRRPFEAAEHFRRSLASNFQQADVHCDLGHCLFKLRRFPEAADAYRQSLAIQPELKVPKQSLEKIEREIDKQSGPESFGRWRR